MAMNSEKSHQGWTLQIGGSDEIRSALNLAVQT